MGTFWRFWGFPVKTVCNPGLPGNPSQQRKRHTDLRGSSHRSSRGSILPSLCAQDPNRPLGGSLRSPPKVGVPFSLLNWIPWEAKIAHRFRRKSPKSPKSAKNRGTPPFWPIFQEVPPYIGPPIGSRWLEVRGFPPLGHPKGEKPHFSAKSENLRSDIGGNFPKPCFLEGGPPLNPVVGPKRPQKGAQRPQRGQNCPKYCQKLTSKAQISP